MSLRTSLPSQQIYRQLTEVSSGDATKVSRPTEGAFCLARAYCHATVITVMAVQHVAYRRLRRTILSGHVAPNERLSHRKLAIRLNVGLRPMREAMLRLDAEGLLEHVPQSGTRLRRPAPNETENLFDLRELIEPYAAARAARMARPEEAGRLQRICARMTELIPRLVSGGPDAWLGDLGHRLRVLDLQFHR